MKDFSWSIYILASLALPVVLWFLSDNSSSSISAAKLADMIDEDWNRKQESKNKDKPFGVAFSIEVRKK